MSSLAKKLREARERLGLTQAEAAQALGVVRELISLWESGKRVPSLAYIRDLARLYGVEEESLLGEGSLKPAKAEALLLRGEPSSNLELRKWLDFLDAWAEFLGDLGEQPKPLRRPPKALDKGGEYTDRRSVAQLAEQVRKHYNLGLDALPDLYTFLDELGVLVYRAPLEPLAKSKISGAFYNHPKLGWSILVNVDTTPGRQAFTLAHEFAHALYHYRTPGIVSRSDEKPPMERFADAWAAHFLVPGRAIRQQLKRLNGEARVRDAFQAMWLARYFRVSYNTMLIRLRTERLIDQFIYEEWRFYNVSDLAQRLGLPVEEYKVPEAKARGWNLERYPLSVLEKVRRAIEGGSVSVAEAAAILDVDRTALEIELLSPPKKEPTEMQALEASELEDVLPF